MTPDALKTIELVAGLGQTGIVLWFFYIFWQDRKEGNIRRDTTIDKKDDSIQKMSEKVLQVVEKNTEVMSEVKSSNDALTKAVDTLTERIYENLKNNQKK